MVHDRWLIDANFERGPARFFDGAPEPARTQIMAQAREKVHAALHGQGLGRPAPARSSPRSPPAPSAPHPP